jgi:hypothetical protein
LRIAGRRAITAAEIPAAAIAAGRASRDVAKKSLRIRNTTAATAKVTALPDAQFAGLKIGCLSPSALSNSGPASRNGCPLLRSEPSALAGA